MLLESISIQRTQMSEEERWGCEETEEKWVLLISIFYCLNLE